MIFPTLLVSPKIKIHVVDRDMIWEVADSWAKDLCPSATPGNSNVLPIYSMEVFNFYILCIILSILYYILCIILSILCYKQSIILSIVKRFMPLGNNWEQQCATYLLHGKCYYLWVLQSILKTLPETNFKNVGKGWKR